MIKMMAFDPSGNWKEGKGTTGICILVNGEPRELHELKAKDFKTPEKYWLAHKRFIEAMEPDYVVMEGYRLYNHKGMKASTQANSELETPQLIGVLKVACLENHIPFHVQYATEVKARWSDNVLVNIGILERKAGNRLYFDGEATSNHKRDALRHALHYWKYGGWDE